MKNRLYWRLLQYVKPYWRMFAGAILAMVIVAITEPALPALLKPLLDGGFVEKNLTLIQLLPIVLISLTFIRGVATLASSVGLTWVANRVVMDLRLALFNKILTLPTTEFDNTSSGILLSKVTYDVNRVMLASTDALIIVVRDSLAIVGLLAWMFYVNWLLSSIVFTVFPVIIVIVRNVSRRLRTMNTANQDAMGNMTRILEEAISGHKLIKVFGGQHYENTRFQAASNAVRQLVVKTEMISGISVFSVQMLTAAVLAVIIYIAAKQSVNDAITVGGFVSLFTAMGMLFAPIKRLTKVNDQLQQGLAAAESIFALIDKVSEKDCGQYPTTRLRGKVEFKNVHFTYTELSKPALQAISLTILPGETVAIVGASGSGKTTLINLIPHFYPLTHGQLLLDDIAIDELSLADLRANVALVSQEIVLFNDSVRANIAYGTLAGAPLSDIVTAARAAYAWEFIEQMPHGLETVIGERGVKLSGGQRQRLAIARALLKNAPILLFDEATSALDTQSEQQVQQALAQLKQGRTTIIVAHRLSTIAHADRIVVLDKGNIVEIGTHDELLDKRGIYAKLYQVQDDGNLT